MKTFTNFVSEAYGRHMSYDAPRRPLVRGKDYECYKNMDTAGQKLGLPEEIEIEEGIGMTVASALGNPPLLSNRMKLKQALISNKIKRNAEKNKNKKYSGKAVPHNNGS